MPRNITLKICGITEEKALHAALEAGADFIGFVHFPPSPRHISLEAARRLAGMIGGRAKTVLVAVDPTDAFLSEWLPALRPDFLQLHGKEDAARLKEIRMQWPQVKLIKGVGVRTAEHVSRAVSDYSGAADHLLFDAKPPAEGTLPGGNGLTFDWQSLSAAPDASAWPWMLSGGLTADNIAEAVRRTAAPMLDVSSGVEYQPGQKDPHAIRHFIENARAAAAL